MDGRQRTVLCLVVAPTCTGFGYTLHTCTSCANSYKDTETQPRGHSFATTACTRCGSAKADGEVITTEETYTYIYNGDKLSQMNVGNKSLYFAYDASGQPMSILYDADTTDTTDGITYYYITNIQGDVIGIADSAGTQVVSYIYDAWGNILDTDGSMEETLGTINPLRYRGYVYDNESQLYYLQSRYYKPEIGRFINADNAIAGATGELLGYNVFAFCFNNPINHSDPSGNWPQWVETAAIVASAVVLVAAVAVTVSVVSVATAGTGSAAAVYGASVLLGAALAGINGAVANRSKGNSYANGYVGGLVGGATQAAASVLPAGNIWGGAIGAGRSTAITMTLNHLDPDSSNSSIKEIAQQSVSTAFKGAATGTLTHIMGLAADVGVASQANGLMPELTLGFGEGLKAFFGWGDDAFVYLWE